MRRMLGIVLELMLMSSTAMGDIDERALRNMKIGGKRAYCTNEQGYWECVDENFKLIDGTIYSTYLEGNLWIKIPVVKGRPDGVAKEYCENGRLRWEGVYIEGKLGKQEKMYGDCQGKLQILMELADDLQKQIDEKDAPAQVSYDKSVNNPGIKGGNSQGLYFSELSVSGIDFVKSKIQESWKTIAGGKDDRNIEVVINVKLTKEGLIESVKIEDMRRYRTDTYFQALADSAERAIYIAQDVYGVFKVLSAQSGSRYSDWKESRFVFTPQGLLR